jgi:hypothetical protein
MSDREHTLSSILTQKAAAEQLLTDLMDAQKLARQSLASDSQRDLFAKVTGVSSLDNAIAMTRRSIDAYSRLLEDYTPPEQSNRPVPSAL